MEYVKILKISDQIIEIPQFGTKHSKCFSCWYCSLGNK